MNKHRQLGKAPALSCNPGFTFPNIPRRLISMIHRCPANESELHLARRVTNRNDRSWHDPSYFGDPSGHGSQGGYGSESAAAETAARTYAEIGRAPSELQSLMRISYAVFCLN